MSITPILFLVYHIRGDKFPTQCLKKPAGFEEAQPEEPSSAEERY
jgi:hypothetical protein